MFIVQGEGRGHLSQALALREHLAEAGHTVEKVFVGCSGRRSLPDYFLEGFREQPECFASPYFLHTPNKKGIYVGRTILFNLLRAPRYICAVKRLRREIGTLGPDVVFNFYDGIGALALKRGIPPVKRMGIGHHFFLHLDGYRCNGGNPLHKWFLGFHTRLVMRSCDQVLALSFRESPGSERISVVPPLVRRSFRESGHKPGNRYLVYLLQEGFVTDLIALARNDPSFRADLFSDLPAGTRVPEGICLHPFSDKLFREKMASCKGLITTAGFDTVAEAAYAGIPLGVVPVRNHFEQRCNSVDAEQNGIGKVLDGIHTASLKKLEKAGNKGYREWVDSAGERIIKMMEA